ncbi:unnamed protein product, partial [Prorocentrum cordatum]
AKLEEQLADITKLSAYSSSPLPRAAAMSAVAKVVRAQAESQPNRLRTPLVAQAAELEQATEACGKEHMSSAKELLVAQLRDVRAKLEAKKGDFTQHANVGHRLARAEKQLAKLTGEVESQDDVIKEATAERDEVGAKRRAAATEGDALQKQLVAAIPRGVPHAKPSPPSLEIPAGMLEGKEEIKSMLESQAFKEYAALIAQTQKDQAPDGSGVRGVQAGEDIGFLTALKEYTLYLGPPGWKT